MSKLFYVTGNPGKLQSAKKYLNDIDIEMIDYDFIEPEINDIEEIAKWKVKEAYKLTNEPCIALDSGFYIPSYPEEKNFPGAFVKRKLIEGIGLDGLIDKMKDVEDRYCYFLECVAYYDGNEMQVFFGKSEGMLSKERSHVDNSKKWSPLWEVFIPLGYKKTLSEMTDYEREHREYSTHGFLEFKKWYLQEKNKVKIKD